MKDILKYSIWAGVCTVLIVPFIVSNGMFFPYITGKAFTFRIIVEILFGLWLILIMKDKEFRPKWSWVLGAAGIFTLILLIADIQAVAPFKAFWSNFERMEGWVTIVHLLAYFIVLGSMLNTEKLWFWFLRANVAAGVLMAIISIDNATVVRFSGPLGNPIYIAVYFLFIFFFSLILLYKDVLAKNLKDWSSFKEVFSNILFYIYPVVAAVSLYVMAVTSRGALIGAIGGIFVGAMAIALFEREKVVIKQMAIGGLIVVVAVISIFMSIRDTSFVKNNSTLARYANISWNNVNDQARQMVWPMAIEGFKEKPILGWGQDGFNYVFNKNYDPGMYAQESWFDRAHDAPLDFLVAGGILGLLAYLSLFISALYLIWFKRNSLSVTERSLLTGLFAGYLFQAIFVFDNLVSYIFFFTTLAYVHSRSVENDENKPAFRFMSEFISNEEYQNYILIPVVVALTTISVVFVNIPGIMANKTLIQALNFVQRGSVPQAIEAFKSALAYKSMGDSEIREQLLSITPSVLRSEGIDQKTKQDFFDLAISEVQKQIAIVPNDARYYFLMASLFNNINKADVSMPYIQKAIELSPKKQAMRFQLVQALYMLGKSTEAMAEAKAAYELDTRFDQAKQIYIATIDNEIKVDPKFKIEGEKILAGLNAVK